MGLLGRSKGLRVPGQRQTREEAGREDEALRGTAAGDCCARASLTTPMAIGRPDMASTVKELCRGMAGSARRDAEALKRLTCYLFEHAL